MYNQWSICSLSSVGLIWKCRFTKCHKTDAFSFIYEPVTEPQLWKETKHGLTSLCWDGHYTKMKRSYPVHSTGGHPLISLVVQHDILAKQGVFICYLFVHVFILEINKKTYFWQKKMKRSMPKMAPDLHPIPMFRTNAGSRKWTLLIKHLSSLPTTQSAFTTQLSIYTFAH